MKDTEIEIRFRIPDAAQARIRREMDRPVASTERLMLTAHYLDTADRRLAEAGLSWRLRREGRRWVQALKGPAAGGIGRFEHEVLRPDATPDPAAHNGTAPGDRLAALVARASDDGVDIVTRYGTRIRRIQRRVRTPGAVVAVAFDDGWLEAEGARQRVLEIEFELVAGSSVAMLRLVERWRARFGLVHEPQSKAERGDRLAAGVPYIALRKARRASYPRRASASEAFVQILDECLEQITRNAAGIAHGDPDLQVEHVHQLRVGIRRLRSALRTFRGWVQAPPAPLVDALRTLFDEAGRARDRDVLAQGVAVELGRAGAPPIAWPAAAAEVDPVQMVIAATAQQTLLAWIAWQAGLAEPNEPPAATGANELDSVPCPHLEAKAFRRALGRRLRRWHQHLVIAAGSFDTLAPDALHALRRRIKRQRYATQFFEPLIEAGRIDPYAEALASAQQLLGDLNDLFVARDRLGEKASGDPAAWFARGWLAARIAELRARLRPELERLAAIVPPRR